MRVFLILLALGCLCQAARVTDAEIAALVEKLQKVAKGESGITSDEQLVAKRLQKVGAPAIPYLLPLLESSNKGIRDLTSYTLRDIDGLTENDLDALIASCRKGDGWIPPAIAKIGNQKAVEFLVAELVRQRQAETQLTFAVSMLGAKAVPYLVDVYRTNDSWDTELDRALLSVFHDMGSKGSTAIDPLLEVAVDENVDPERRVRAINAVSAIGTSAERAVPTLQKLRLSPVPKISSAAANAIISSGSAEAVPILTGRLDAEPDELYIKLIAGLGNHGESAGPSLARGCF